jgi:hypothetical protein
MTKLSLVYAVAVMLAGIFAVRRSKAILRVSDNPKTIIGVAAIALIYGLAAFGHFFIHRRYSLSSFASLASPIDASKIRNAFPANFTVEQLISFESGAGVASDADGIPQR